MLAFLRLLLLCGLIGLGYAYSSERAAHEADNADHARVIARFTDAAKKAEQDAKAAEAQAAKRANAIAAQYEQDKLNAESAAKRTADDLRAGNLRLRQQWEGCKAGGVPQANGAAGQPDAAADDRAESAGRIVRAADDADAQIKALQQFIRSER